MKKNEQNKEIKLKNLSLEEKAELGLYGMKKGDGVRLERLKVCFDIDKKSGVVIDSERLAIYRENRNILLILEGKDKDGDDIATRATVIYKEQASGEKYVLQIRIGDKEMSTIVSAIDSYEFDQRFELEDTEQQKKIQEALDIVNKTDSELEKIISKAKDKDKKKSWVEWGTDLVYGPDYKEKKEAGDARAKEIAVLNEQYLAIIDEERRLHKEIHPSKEKILSNDNIIVALQRKSEKMLKEVKTLESTPQSIPVVKELTAKRKEHFVVAEEKSKHRKQVLLREEVIALDQKLEKIQEDIKVLEETPIMKELTAKWNEVSAISKTISKLHEEAHPSRERILTNQQRITDLAHKREKLLKRIKELESQPIVIASDKALEKAAEELRAKSMAFLSEARIPSKDVLASAHNLRVHGAQKNKEFIEKQAERKKMATPLPLPPNHIRQSTTISFW